LESNSKGLENRFGIEFQGAGEQVEIESPMAGEFSTEGWRILQIWFGIGVENYPGYPGEFSRLPGEFSNFGWNRGWNLNPDLDSKSDSKESGSDSNPDSYF
jgi:hypothetical protein